MNCRDTHAFFGVSGSCYPRFETISCMMLESKQRMNPLHEEGKKRDFQVLFWQKFDQNFFQNIFLRKTPSLATQGTLGVPELDVMDPEIQVQLCISLLPTLVFQTCLLFMSSNPIPSSVVHIRHSCFLPASCVQPQKDADNRRLEFQLPDCYLEPALFECFDLLQDALCAMPRCATLP